METYIEEDEMTLAKDEAVEEEIFDEEIKQADNLFNKEI